MARARLTIDQARHLDFKDLLEAGYALLQPFEAPDMETPNDLDKRISKTLDELPDIYAWFNQLHAWFDHWADFYYNKEASGAGPSSLEYKTMRQKRDAMKQLASSAKLRYEGTSRRLTQIQSHEHEAGMPRTRRG